MAFLPHSHHVRGSAEQFKGALRELGVLLKILFASQRQIPWER